MFFYHAVRERYADPLSDRCGGPPFSTPRSPMWPGGPPSPAGMADPAADSASSPAYGHAGCGEGAAPAAWGTLSLAAGR